MIRQAPAEPNPDSKLLATFTIFGRGEIDDVFFVCFYLFCPNMANFGGLS